MKRGILFSLAALCLAVLLPLTVFATSFTVSGTVGTTYKVEVSNNGGTTWVELDSKQTLTVKRME